MVENSTFDPETGLLQAPVRELYQKRFQLKKELARIDRALKTHETILKQFMAKHGYKKVEMQGFRLVYMYPRVYYHLNP